ncbi:hypothetical protein [Nocardia alni]|uniref:hypothetical protein n=1 Tax=Nocardia alni TaxID=2815723 RepID=UPI001C22637F|nr:hypothetical protein [Nocardia alni]
MGVTERIWSTDKESSNPMTNGANPEPYRNPGDYMAPQLKTGLKADLLPEETLRYLLEAMDGMRLGRPTEISLEEMADAYLEAVAKVNVEHFNWWQEQ